MPAVSGRYIVCPFCNSKKCKKECKSKKEGGISMYDKIYEIIQSADDFVWGWGMIALLLGTHLFLTVRTGLIQRKTITKGIRLSVAKEEGADGEVSQFGALATALASTIGTGNIIGVGTAIALGGPGAVFWCWITGIFGIATKYAESLIAVKYRVKTEDGRMQGGAMYALERGLNMRWLGLAFAFLAGFASFGIGCATQVNAIAEVCSKNLGIDPFVVGVVVAGMTAVVIFGGIKSIAKVCEKLVPFMALLYILLGLGVILLNIQNVPSVFVSIFKGAFQPSAVTGGIIGSMFLSIKKGVSRGIFSNEAGLGTGSIAHACADTKKPVKQGMFGIFEVFTDTIVICTLTALVILCSGVPITYGEAAGAELTILGFTSTYGNWVSIFTAVAMCCFAFSTALGWGLYGARCIEFLFSEKVIKPFMVVYALVAILGATANLGLMWNIAETFNGLMAIPNLIALFLLSGTVVRLTKEYFAGEGKEN